MKWRRPGKMRLFCLSRYLLVSLAVLPTIFRWKIANCSPEKDTRQASRATAPNYFREFHLSSAIPMQARQQGRMQTTDPATMLAALTQTNPQNLLGRETSANGRIIERYNGITYVLHWLSFAAARLTA